MALYQLNFESEYLGNNHTVSVIMPDRPKDTHAADFYGTGKKYKVLWLLHGTFGDHWDWVRKSMIEIYAREVNLIVVMPSGMNADYQNWSKFGIGYNMKDYLTKELMPLIYNWFPASDKREDNFIAGLSMGSWGALGYTLDNPEKFAASAMLSACPRDPSTIDWVGYENGTLDPVKDYRLINQIDNAGGKDGWLKNQDYWTKFFDSFEKGIDLPKMYFCCGTADKLVGEGYYHFKEECLKKNIPVSFHEIEGYAHEWRFWDKEIQNAFRFFGLTDKEYTDTF